MGVSSWENVGLLMVTSSSVSSPLLPLAREEDSTLELELELDIHTHHRGWLLVLSLEAGRDIRALWIAEQAQEQEQGEDLVGER